MRGRVRLGACGQPLGQGRAVRAPAVVRALLSGTLAAIVLACGGGGGGNESVVPRLMCSGATSPAPDQVTLGCPAEGIDSITVAVHLGGPTTSSDIYGLKFDLVFDPTVLQFEPPAMEGSFLNRDGAATILQAGSLLGGTRPLLLARTAPGAPAGLQGAGTPPGLWKPLVQGGTPGGATPLF